MIRYLDVDITRFTLPHKNLDLNPPYLLFGLDLDVVLDLKTN